MGRFFEKLLWRGAECRRNARLTSTMPCAMLHVMGMKATISPGAAQDLGVERGGSLQ